MSLFYMYFLYCSLVYSSALSFPQFSIIMKLNWTNYKEWVKSLIDEFDDYETELSF